jgi:uncharacterized Fe-S cluster protein YjdI
MYFHNTFPKPKFSFMEKHITKRYFNGEITVVWKSHVCIHSAVCFKGLPQVFDPRRRPWIILENSDTDTIVDQVKKCPSGALAIFEDK